MQSLLKIITSVVSLFASRSDQAHVGDTNITRAVAPPPPPRKHSVAAGKPLALRPITTKIVGFTSFEYLPIALRWYDVLTSLGYDNHFIVATDLSSVAYLESLPAIRHETELRPGAVKTLFASRIKYMKRQLMEGYNVLLTDVDNIFRRYVSTDVFEEEPYDVIHAFENKFPEDVYEKQGFVVCGGMTFFRADPNGTRAYEYLNRTSETCYRLCDDQRVLNRILANELHVVWTNETTTLESPNVSANTSVAGRRHRPSGTQQQQVLDPRFLKDGSDQKFRGLGAISSSRVGISKATGLRVKIWDRNFAYRGPIDPDPCPDNNWVSMPVIWVPSRKEGPLFKFRMFDAWEKHCEEEVEPTK